MGRSIPPVCGAALASPKSVPIHETELALAINWCLAIVWLAPLGYSREPGLMASVRIRIASWRRFNAQSSTLGIETTNARHRASEGNSHEDIPEHPQPLDFGEADMYPMPYVALGRSEGPSPLLGSLMGMI